MIKRSTEDVLVSCATAESLPSFLERFLTCQWCHPLHLTRFQCLTTLFPSRYTAGRVTGCWGRWLLTRCLSWTLQIFVYVIGACGRGLPLVAETSYLSRRLSTASYALGSIYVRRQFWYSTFLFLDSSPYILDYSVYISLENWPIKHQLPSDLILLNRSPNIGPLMSRWELEKFKNCWNNSFRTSRILTLLYQKFSNLLISQWDMSGPRLGALSNRARQLCLWCWGTVELDEFGTLWSVIDVTMLLTLILS